MFGFWFSGFFKAWENHSGLQGTDKGQGERKQYPIHPIPYYGLHLPSPKNIVFPLVSNELKG
jgi:hypothetical protein